jgi:hypothetical protein
MRKNLLEKIAGGVAASTPLADEVIAMLLTSVKENVRLAEFTMAHHRLAEERFFDYAKLSLYWGYNFARSLLIEKPSVYI